MDSPDPLLYTDGVTDLVNQHRPRAIKPGTWSAYVSAGRTPAPDDPGDVGVPRTRRRPRWRKSTIEEWIAEQKGQGYRSDKHKKTAAQRKQWTAELAEAPAPTRADEQAWLVANRAALFDATDLLIDNHDQLVALAGDRRGGEMAEAINAAGLAHNSATAASALARAVVYALGILRLVDLPEGVELTARIRRHDGLHDSYNAVRPPRA
jgi:hypothetical protein